MAEQDRTEYFLKYAKTHYKRIPLDVSKEKYEQIRSAASNAGESVNGYIKTAIDTRMQAEGITDQEPEQAQDQD